MWLTKVANVGVNRYAKSRALKHLRSAGLVDVVQQRGRIPLVTIKLPVSVLAQGSASH
jgi:hypothetical protein